MRWYFGLNVLGVCLLFQAVVFGIAFFSFTFYIEPWRQEFGVSRADIMLIFVAMQISMGFLSPFAGRALDKYSIRALVAMGLSIFSAGLFLSSLASSLWIVGAIYSLLVVFGILLAGPLASQILAGRWFVSRRGTAIGLVATGTSIGGFLLPIVIATLIGEFGWRTTNQVLAAFTLVIVVPIVWLIVRNPPEDSSGVSESGANGEVEVELPWRVADILRARAFFALILAFVPLITASGAMQQNFAPFVADLGIDAERASYLVAMYALVMVGGKVFFGFMADVWDQRWLFVLGCVLLVISLLLMLSDPAWWLLVVISITMGLSAGGFLPLLGAMVSRHFGMPSFGQVMGLFGPFMTATALGPWLAGYLRDTTGSYEAAWMAAICAAIVSAAGIWLLPAEQQRA
ncbi:MAG: MFS transporter [Gammaproteobacteria bacterium]|nr:MFS transporter [Gammaproteobacteria bacterium]MBT4493484.1 MFS transporter [Gammaproteobacteria bacterium]MBT7369602.1 MFS transporter [Gammaproteobacteria bacterium]